MNENEYQRKAGSVFHRVYDELGNFRVGDRNIESMKKHIRTSFDDAFDGVELDNAEAIQSFTDEVFVAVEAYSGDLNTAQVEVLEAAILNQFEYVNCDVDGNQ